MPLVPIDRLQTLSPVTVGSETDTSFHVRAIEGRYHYDLHLDTDHVRFRLRSPRQPDVVVYVPMGNVAWWSETRPVEIIPASDTPPATLPTPARAAASAAELAALADAPPEEAVLAAAAQAASQIEARRNNKYRSIRDVDGSRE